MRRTLTVMLAVLLLASGVGAIGISAAGAQDAEGGVGLRRGAVESSLTSVDASAHLSSVGRAGALALGAHEARIPMHITGFDEAVAAANGYAIVRLDSGYEASVPAAAAAEVRTPEEAVQAGGVVEYGAIASGGVASFGSGSPVSPSGVVYGDCGYAWIYMEEYYPLAYQQYTGFYLYGSNRAWWYYWYTPVFGPAYFYSHFDNSLLGNRQSWWANNIGNVSRGGQYTGYMYGGALNYALLTNGGLCTAGESTSSVDL